MNKERRTSKLLLLQIFIAGFLFQMILLAPGLFGQTPDCSKFKNGTFLLVGDNDRNYMIVRKGKHQKESYKDLTFEFTVKWIDDCTYTLAPTKKTLELNPDFAMDGIITVKITEVKENSYIQSSSSNFTEGVLTSEMVRVED